jgi:hypothetical protein
VAGGVDRAHAQTAELEHEAVLERLVVVGGPGQRVHVDRRARGRRKAAVARDVVGVVVGLEDVLDVDVQVAGELEVLVDLEARVYDRGHAGVLVADQIRGAAEVVVDDLAEDHGGSISSRRGSWGTRRAASRRGHRWRRAPAV